MGVDVVSLNLLERIKLPPCPLLTKHHTLHVLPLLLLLLLLQLLVLTASIYYNCCLSLTRHVLPT
jgi:hypothetical protein